MSDFETDMMRMMRDYIDRESAIRWLADNIGVDGWPQYVEGYRSGRLVSNWMFVDTLPDREIVFANMISPSITKQQLDYYVSQEQKETH